MCTQVNKKLSVFCVCSAASERRFLTILVTLTFCGDGVPAEICPDRPLLPCDAQPSAKSHHLAMIKTAGEVTVTFASQVKHRPETSAGTPLQKRPMEDRRAVKLWLPSSTCLCSRSDSTIALCSGQPLLTGGVASALRRNSADMVSSV